MKPKFKECFHVEVCPPRTVFLLSEKGHFVLNGYLYCLLAPLLTGVHTVAEIAAHLEGQAKIDEITYGLEQLERKGYITNTDSLPPAESAFWELLNRNTEIVDQRLRSTKVSITTFGNVTGEVLETILASLNVGVADGGEFSVVLTDDYLQPGLADFNRKALQANRSWLLVKPIGGVIWIGPIFRPYQTGCWECLAQRLRINREVESFIQEQKQSSEPLSVARAALASTLQTGLNLIATEVAKWVTHPEHHSLEDTILTFDLINLNLQRHFVVRRPQCRCCGELMNLAHTQPQPLLLTDRKKQLVDDGGYRQYLPELAAAQYEHHISPITGIIKQLFQPFPYNELVHAYVAEHCLPIASKELKDLGKAARPKSFGKGKTAAQAKMSAVGEAIERYSGTYTGEEITIKATYAELGELAIHPHDLMQYSAEQYRDRQIWNQQHHLIQWVADPFNASEVIDWTPIWSLTQQKFKYIPTAYCYYGYPLAENHCFCYADTNGTSAGTCQEEAILQGFMELVERDAVAIWWYNRTSRPAVDLQSFAEPYLNHLQTYYQIYGRDFWVLDITTDFNIPTFAAISRRVNHQPEDILFGFGTHFDAKIALLRAVTEMNQMVFLSQGANPHASAKFTRPDMQNWCMTATLENQPYLAPNQSLAAKTYADYTPYCSDNLLTDVLTCIDLAARQGLEMLVLDQTQPDIGMSVVKVVVPGLRHFWAQFAPGRLYDVPVKLGWLKTPLPESELNPIPMFI
ncbi:TOMM precursor leader peptide-binding protein [Nostoc sp. CMAA1605]|uniref:TOMM precursor leader peptide-binding protein n=1 Tax=Nostoc sp. CMAA1605 TaxID=2055159 RepID=UPI001FA6382C|nr:TOMM precursor leader peptide-binding protein [Nostoc sp. CMAA1605]MCF4966835.1 adenylate cyclase [Nostoc sp. CMAA1605]